MTRLDNKSTAQDKRASDLVRFLCLLLSVGTIACHKSEQPRQSFKSVAEAVAFIEGAVERSDYQGLKAACTGPGDRLLLTTYVRLSKLHKKTRLSKLFAGQSFPEHGHSFKLGGHGPRNNRNFYDHVNIRFHRVNGRWHLRDIFICK